MTTFAQPPVTFRRDRFGECWHLIPAGALGIRSRTLCGQPRQGTALSETYAEVQPAAPECRWQSHRHDEAEQHRGQQQRPHHAMVRVEPVGDPRRVDPGPPHREQQDHGLSGATPAQLVKQQVRKLGDGEYVHQVEEQLGVRDASVRPSAVPPQPRCPSGRGGWPCPLIPPRLRHPSPRRAGSGTPGNHAA